MPRNLGRYYGCGDLPQGDPTSHGKSCPRRSAAATYGNTGQDGAREGTPLRKTVGRGEWTLRGGGRNPEKKDEDRRGRRRRSGSGIDNGSQGRGKSRRRRPRTATDESRR